MTQKNTEHTADHPCYISRKIDPHIRHLSTPPRYKQLDRFIAKRRHHPSKTHIHQTLPYPLSSSPNNRKSQPSQHTSHRILRKMRHLPNQMLRQHRIPRKQHLIHPSNNPFTLPRRNLRRIHRISPNQNRVPYIHNPKRSFFPVSHFIPSFHNHTHPQNLAQQAQPPCAFPQNPSVPTHKLPPAFLQPQPLSPPQSHSHPHIIRTIRKEWLRSVCPPGIS